MKQYPCKNEVESRLQKYSLPVITVTDQMKQSSSALKYCHTRRKRRCRSPVQSSNCLKYDIGDHEWHSEGSNFEDLELMMIWMSLKGMTLAHFLALLKRLNAIVVNGSQLLQIECAGDVSLFHIENDLKKKKMSKKNNKKWFHCH